jgi:thiamine kinase-like enzyme
MPDRQEHQQEVYRFLQAQLSTREWSFSTPRSTGMETYFAHGDGQDYFIKIGAPVERYIAMAEIGLAPPVITVGQLESSLSILVQPRIVGRRPSRKDYHDHLDRVAAVIHTMHHCPQVQRLLPAPSSSAHKDAGSRALNRLQQKWQAYRVQVPSVAEFVDESLEVLGQRVSLFSGAELVTSHNDICNANWLFTPGGEIYLIDFESMSMDDPACDVGALLWWYYPPELRGRFLGILGYDRDPEFQFRMQVRMAMHCLDITLPREHSFDEFDPQTYDEALADYRAILAGEENPQGYD